MAESFLLVWLDVLDSRIISLAHQLDALNDNLNLDSSEDAIDASGLRYLDVDHCSALKAGSNTFVAISGHPILSEASGISTSDGDRLGLRWLSPQRASAVLREAWRQRDFSKTWDAAAMVDAANNAAHLLRGASLREIGDASPLSMSNTAVVQSCELTESRVHNKCVDGTMSIELLCVVNSSITDGPSNCAFGWSPRDTVTGTALWSMISSATSPHSTVAASTVATADGVSNGLRLRCVRFWDVSAVESAPHLDTSLSRIAMSSFNSANASEPNITGTEPRLKRPWSTWAKLSGATVWAHTTTPPPLQLELGTISSGRPPLLGKPLVPLPNHVKSAKEIKDGSTPEAPEGEIVNKGKTTTPESKLLHLDPRGATSLRWQGSLHMNYKKMWRGGGSGDNGSIDSDNGKSSKSDEIFIEIFGIVSERDRRRLLPSPLRGENGSGGYRIEGLEVMMSLPQVAWADGSALRTLAAASPPPWPSNNNGVGAWLTSPSEAGAIALTTLTQRLCKEGLLLVCRAVPTVTRSEEKACASSVPNKNNSDAYGPLHDGYNGVTHTTMSNASASSKSGHQSKNPGSGQSRTSSKQRNKPNGPPPPLFLVLSPLMKAPRVTRDGTSSVCNVDRDCYAQLQCTFLVPSSAVNPQGLAALLSRPHLPLQPLPPDKCTSINGATSLMTSDGSAVPLRQLAVTSMPRLRLSCGKDDLGHDNSNGSSVSINGSNSSVSSVLGYVQQMQATVVAIATEEANLRRSRSNTSTRRKSTSEPERQQPRRTAKTRLSSGGVNDESTTIVADAEEIEKSRRIAVANAAHAAAASAAWERQQRAATAVAATRIAREAVPNVLEPGTPMPTTHSATATSSDGFALATVYADAPPANAPNPARADLIESVGIVTSAIGDDRRSEGNSSNNCLDLRTSTAAAQYYWHHRAASSADQELSDRSSSLSRGSSFGVAGSSTKAAPTTARPFSRAPSKGGTANPAARGETKYARGRAVAAKARDALNSLELANKNKDKKVLNSSQPRLSMLAPAVATTTAATSASTSKSTATAAPSAAIAALVNANVADEAQRLRRRKERRSRTSKEAIGSERGVHNAAVSSATVSNIIPSSSVLKRNLSTGSIGSNHSIVGGASLDTTDATTSSSSSRQSYTSAVRSYPGNAKRSVGNTEHQKSANNKRWRVSNASEADDIHVSTLDGTRGRSNSTSSTKRHELHRSSTDSLGSQGSSRGLVYHSEDSTGTLLEDDASLGGDTSRSSQDGDNDSNAGSQDRVPPQFNSSSSSANKRKRGSNGAAMRSSSLFPQLRQKELESPPALVRRRLSPGSNSSGGSNSSAHEQSLARPRIKLFGGTGTRCPAIGASSLLSLPQVLASTSTTATSEALPVAPEENTAAAPGEVEKVTSEQYPSASLRSPSKLAHGSLVAANSVASPATAAVTAAAATASATVNARALSGSTTPTAADRALRGDNGSPTENRLFNSPHPTASLPKHSPTLGSSFSSSSASSSSSSMAPPPPRSPSQSPARSSLRSPSRSFLQSPLHQASSAQYSSPARGAAYLPVSSPPSLPVRGFCQSPLAATTAAAALASAVNVTINATNSALVLPQARSSEVVVAEEQNDMVPLRERIEAALHAWALDHNSSYPSNSNDGISQSTEEHSSVDFRQSVMTSISQELNLDSSPSTTAVVDLIMAAAVDIIAMRQHLRNVPSEAHSNVSAASADVSSNELSSGELQRLVYLYADLLGYS